MEFPNLSPGSSSDLNKINELRQQCLMHYVRIAHGLRQSPYKRNGLNDYSILLTQKEEKDLTPTTEN
jgi:hypothetical protein